MVVKIIRLLLMHIAHQHLRTTKSRFPKSPVTFPMSPATLNLLDNPVIHNFAVEGSMLKLVPRALFAKCCTLGILGHIKQVVREGTR